MCKGLGLCLGLQEPETTGPRPRHSLLSASHRDCNTPHRARGAKNLHHLTDLETEAQKW